MANEMIEIPFGTYTIPEDMTAEIKDGKIVVVKKKESEYNALEFLKGQAIEMIASIEHDISQSVYDGIKGHSPEDERELERWKKALAWLEKQKEQKPTQTNAEKEYVRTIKGIIADFIRDKQPKDVAFYQKIYDWLDGRHIEQKPAEWSEEDEKMIQSLVLEIGKFAFFAGIESKKIIRFLKSLRPQAKQEWNKTDKTQLLQLIEEGVTKSLCRKGFHFHFDEEYAKDLIEYICSFNPSKSNWKPSEEQMNHLGYAYTQLKLQKCYAPHVYETLGSLYDDLQKLL